MTLPHLLLLFGTLLLMEPLVALFHRHVMHGVGWAWHRSHHQPGGRLERNDLYAVLMAAGTFGLFLLAGGPDSGLWWVALGISIYGFLYALVHDGLVHRRFSLRGKAGKGYLKRLVDAHHLHHAVRERDGAVSFGFLYAPPLEKLRARLKERRP